MKTHSRIHRLLGFTLIEILITITIILILATLSIGGLQYIKIRQANSQAEIQINLLTRGIEEYKLDIGDYPGDENAGGATGEGQSNLLYLALYYDGFEAGNNGEAIIYLPELDPNNNQQRWINGTGSSATIVDPWKSEYRYRRGTQALNPDFDLWSPGKDKLTSGDASSDIDKDDISNF